MYLPNNDIVIYSIIATVKFKNLVYSVTPDTKLQT